MKNKSLYPLIKLQAFTIAEVLITLIILGIVAAISIPNLINKQIENQNRTKVKKAMAMYEKVVNEILLENNLKSQEMFKSWAKKDAIDNNYSKQRAYFKIIDESSSNPNCIFKTTDNVWWNICGTNESNIGNPIIILDESYKDYDRAELEKMAVNENINGKKLYIYALIGRLDISNGAVRINDKSYENSKNMGNYPKYMDKLYNFISKINTTSVSDDTILNSLLDQLSECVSWPCTIKYYCSDADNTQLEICSANYILKQSISEQEASDAATTKTFLCDWDGEKCSVKTTSTIESMDMYVSEELALTLDEAKSPENCEKSRNVTYCLKNGDYWTLARRKCEEQGAHLPSIAELKALYNKQDGTLDSSSTYWAAESNSNNSKMGYILNSSDGGAYSTKYNIIISDKMHKAICVGN